MIANKLLLRSHLSPGDIVTLTAAVRDLHASHPGRFLTDVDTAVPDLWLHNPYLTCLDRGDPSVRLIDMNYPLVHRSNQQPGHFIEGYSRFLSDTLDIEIATAAFKGDIHLSAEEKADIGAELKMLRGKTPFWIVVAGGKYDFTTKWWPPVFYQSVVDHFRGRLTFVQCGQRDHWHPRLTGAVDLVGQTSVRQFVHLMYHADGVLCPITFAMHLAAALPLRGDRLKPCVVIAGGREPPHWEAYPGHQFLHTVGAIPCCARGGCWRSRCQLMLDGDPKDRDNLCEAPVQLTAELRIPRCMMMITPNRVIDAIESYLLWTPTR